MYERACFIGSAFETIEKLNEKYEIFIVNAYIIKDGIHTSGCVLRDKFNWLQENIPFINLYNYVFTDNKEVIDCDIKIDYKISNLTGNSEIKLLSAAYHNKKLTVKELSNKNIQRIDTWEEIEKNLL